MTKIIAKTKPGTQLLGAAGAEETIPHSRPAVVRLSYFIETKLEMGCIEKLGEDLPDTATDASWAEHLADKGGDVDAAVASYGATLPAEAPPVTDDDKAKGRQDRTTGNAPKGKSGTYRQPATASDLKA